MVPDEQVATAQAATRPSTNARSLLTVRGVYKEFEPGNAVLVGIDLSVEPGEIVCLLGPSGCGKTTLLRIVAGLEQAERGEVRLRERNLTEIPVHRRHFGLMFQEFALFPHKSVEENVAFGLRMAGQAHAQIGQRVAEMLDLVSLAGYEKRSVFELSGGERQRVALARSLAPSPTLLMLDEPLGSLDRSLREALMNELRAILKQVGVTALYVTHDQQEAFAVADRVVVMNRGCVEQVGRPEEVYFQPNSVFVARFLGLRNLLPATVTPGNPIQAHTPLGQFTLNRPAAPGQYVLLIRPEAVELVGEAGAAAGQLEAILQVRSFRGSYYHVEVLAAEQGKAGPEQEDERPWRLVFDLPSRRWSEPDNRLPAVGHPVHLTVDAEHVQLLNR